MRAAKARKPTARQLQLLAYLLDGPKPRWTNPHPWRPATLKGAEDAGWIRLYTTAAVPGAWGMSMMELTAAGRAAHAAATAARTTDEKRGTR